MMPSVGCNILRKNWCLSCQVNERVALYQPDVIDMFEKKNIVMMKADWTNYDEEITRALATYGKNSIPLYVFYRPGERNNPIFLPEILTPSIVLSILEDL